MDLIKYNEYGQWQLEKADNPYGIPQLSYKGGGPYDGTHDSKPNFQKFQKLVQAHGSGHFSYHAPTDTIRAISDHAKKLVADAKAPKKVAPTPRPAGAPPPAPKTSLKVIDNTPKAITKWPKG